MFSLDFHSLISKSLSTNICVPKELNFKKNARIWLKMLSLIVTYTGFSVEYFEKILYIYDLGFVCMNVVFIKNC